MVGVIIILAGLVEGSGPERFSQATVEQGLPITPGSWEQLVLEKGRNDRWRYAASIEFESGTVRGKRVPVSMGGAGSGLMKVVANW